MTAVVTTSTDHDRSEFTDAMYACAVVLYISTLLVATHLPQNILTHVEEGNRESLRHEFFYHVTAHDGLTLLGLAALGQSKNDWGTAQSYASLLMFVGIFGFTDEVTQPLVGRAFDLTDWLAGIAGAVVAFTLKALFFWREAESSPNWFSCQNVSRMFLYVVL